MDFKDNINPLDQLRTKSPLWWLEHAERWEGALNACRNAEQEVHSDVICGMMGIILELLLKGLIVAKGKEISYSHDLKQLAEKAEFNMSSEEEKACAYFSEFIEWKSRYPAPGLRTGSQIKSNDRYLEYMGDFPEGMSSLSECLEYFSQFNSSFDDIVKRIKPEIISIYDEHQHTGRYSPK